MRYLVRRGLTGEWLTRDLPLTDVERTRTLSGPSVIKGKINPELRDLIHSDGMRLLEEWATMVYAVDEDTGHLRLGGIVVPSTEYEESETTLICMGVAGYPQGFIYEDSKIWGPSTTLPRPDPVHIYRDLWDYVQSFENSDLGVEVIGTRKSDERVGDNAEPYRLRWWEAPDVGEEMNELAEGTPFDYVEHYKWANADHTEVTHQIEIGWPRLGAARDDLRFALGENIIESTVLKSPEAFANNIIGLGNGQGASMVTARASVNDGRLRRTAVFTDKTIRSKDRLDRKVARLLNRNLRGGRVEIDQIVVADHPNAPLSAVRPGDDILVSTFVPSYGGVEQWGRVVGITQGEDDHVATFSLIPSDKFQYSAGPAEEDAAPYVPVYTPLIGTTIRENSGSSSIGAGEVATLALPTGTQLGDLIVVGYIHEATNASCDDARLTLLNSGDLTPSPWVGRWAVYAGRATTLDPVNVRLPAGAWGAAQMVTLHNDIRELQLAAHAGTGPGMQPGGTGTLPGIDGDYSYALAVMVTDGGLGGSYGYSWDAAAPYTKYTEDGSYAACAVGRIVGPLTDIPEVPTPKGDTSDWWAVTVLGIL